jgi:hypothetical protein
MEKLERIARAILSAKGANPDLWKTIENQAQAAIEAYELDAREHRTPRIPFQSKPATPLPHSSED